MIRFKMSGKGWAYVGAILGGAVSVAANVAHSYVPPDKAPDMWTPHVGSIIGSVFWPLALLVAIEILARNSWRVGWRWFFLRYLGLAPVAIVAAVVSYRHMSGLLTYYGEDWVTATFGPLAVDGLMVMATSALIGARVAAASQAPATSAVTTYRFMSGQRADTADAPKVIPRPARQAKQKGKAATPTTAQRIAKLRAAEPGITQAETAKRLKVSDRTVERNWNVTPIRQEA